MLLFYFFFLFFSFPQDNIQFKEPVEIGSILNLKSKVVFAEGAPHKSFQVAVRANVVDIETGQKKTTNNFQFTYYSPDGNLRKVIPQTYEESMEYLEGRRQKGRSLEMKSILAIHSVQDWILDPSKYLK